jgi:hypothetical protein
MKFICVTEVDAKTKIPCTVEPQRNGPSMPEIKGWEYKWADESTWPVTVDSTGIYLRAPKYYGTCDDDADTNVSGVLEVLSESEWLSRKEIEILARKPYPSWVLVGNNWVAPISRPYDAILNGGNVAYRWDEETTSWVRA